MDAILRTPIIILFVDFIAPILFTITLATFLKKGRTWDFLYAVLGVFLFFFLLSYKYRSITLRYSGPLNAGGVYTIFLGYSCLGMALIVYLLSFLRIPGAIKLAIPSLVGFFIIALLGGWVA